MTVDFSHYADNVYYKHLERFRDEMLERKLNGHCRIGDVFNAYDAFCERNNIRHRKIVTHELIPELSRIGVRLGRVRGVGEKYTNTRPAFVTWRLTRNAKYAIRDMPVRAMDYLLAPLGRVRDEDEDRV